MNGNVHILQHILDLLIHGQAIPRGLAKHFAWFIDQILTNPPPHIRPPVPPVI